MQANLAIRTVLSQVQDGKEKVFSSQGHTNYGIQQERTFCYNSLNNSEVHLLLVVSRVHSLDRPFIIMVARLIPR